MSNHVSHAALDYPIKNARFTVEIPYSASGVPTDPTSPDTEYNLDNAGFTDCTEEASTETGGVGMGLLTLTGAEMNGSTLAIASKSANCQTSRLIIRPRVLALVGSGTLSAGSAGGGTLGTLLAYDVTGCFIRTTGGTGGGGTGGANNQARKIVTYNTTTGAFTVSPNWETTPDATTTYDVLLPEGVTLGMLRTLNPTTPGRTVNVGSDGVVESNLKQILATVLTETSAGYLAAAFKKFLDVASPVFTSASVNQSADNNTKITAIQKLLEADWQVDTGTTPWALVALENGTGAIGVGTELLRQPLKDVSGGNITSTSTIIGRAGL